MNKAEKRACQYTGYCKNKSYSDFLNGYRQAEKDIIENTVEWIKNNWREYINVDKDGVVCFGHWENDFRKTMKNET